MKILLLDDHKLLGESLKSNLEVSSKVTSVEITVDVGKAMDNILKLKYDLVLMDISLKNISKKDGLELTKEILRKNRFIKIVILTGFDFPEYEMYARNIGASGFISKNVGIGELIDKLEFISKGGKIFKTIDMALERLTEKEMKILCLYCEGKTRKEISDILMISMRTLANYLNVIYNKLGVHNYQEMMQKAIKLGYVITK